MTAETGYAVFETEGGVGIRAWGADHAQAFAQAALGVLALDVAPAGVQERETRDVRAQGASLEALLVAWIDECVYVHEIEGFAVRRVSVAALGADVVHGTLHGEELDAERHRGGAASKRLSPRRAEVQPTAAGYEIRLVVSL